MDEALYKYKMNMAMQSKVATITHIEDDELIPLSVPHFVGEMGIDIKKLHYFGVKHAREIVAEDHSRNCSSYSWMRVVFPFESEGLDSSHLRAFSSNQIRVGRLLEIMDFMAGRVCYRHCYSDIKEEAEITIVTATVDNIEFYPTKLEISKDMTFEVNFLLI